MTPGWLDNYIASRQFLNAIDKPQDQPSAAFDRYETLAPRVGKSLVVSSSQSASVRHLVDACSKCDEYIPRSQGEFLSQGASPTKESVEDDVGWNSDVEGDPGTLCFQSPSAPSAQQALPALPKTSEKEGEE